MMVACDRRVTLLFVLLQAFLAWAGNPLYIHFNPQRKHVVLNDSDVAGKRVLVIGDVHGCYDEMMALLRKTNVLNSNETDIVDDVVVIFAGDLVNKGPKNLDVLRWVKNSRALSTTGNHELNCLAHGPDKYPWLHEVTEDDLNFLRQTPWTISIPSLSTVVVHAGLMPGVPVEDQDEFVMTRMRNLITNSDGTMDPHEETDKGENWGSIYSGPDHVTYGHDAGRGRDGVQEHQFASGLDTRCVYGGDLTGVFLPATSKDYVSVDCPEYTVYYTSNFEDLH